MRIISFILLLSVYSNNLFSQVRTDTILSSYKNLVIRKSYNVSESAVTTGSVTIYKINDKEVSKEKYYKYYDTSEAIDNCRPCILKEYDENDILLSKGIVYLDCAVGFWIDYYSDGKVKLIGHFKENITGDWSNLWNRGGCDKKDGTWTYFDEKGAITKVEVYKNDELIH